MDCEYLFQVTTPVILLQWLVEQYCQGMDRRHKSSFYNSPIPPTQYNPIQTQIMRQQSLGFNMESLGFPALNHFTYEETNRLFHPHIDDTHHPLHFEFKNHTLIEEVGVVAVKEVRYVNEKQWERIMKRRVRRQLEKMRNLAEGIEEQEKVVKKKYKYESRHLHAEKRVRNQKGRFVPTRPKDEGEKVKKKRGRKSKLEKLMLEQERLRYKLSAEQENEDSNGRSELMQEYDA